MGLFSQTKTIVFTSVSRVVEDDDIPNTMQEALVQAIVGERNISETVAQHLTGSLGVKAGRYYRYGENHYIYGNPSGEVTTANVAYEEIEAILQQELGNPMVTVDYVRFGAINLNHLAWMKLVNEMGYDSRTNELTALSQPEQLPTKLHSMTITVPRVDIANGVYNNVHLIGWEHSASYRDTVLNNPDDPRYAAHYQDLPVWGSEISEPRAVVLSKIHTPWSDSTEGRGTTAHYLPLTGVDLDAEYFHVRYSIEGRHYFWLYRLGEGRYPELDTYFERGEHTKTMGSFFPMLYFRYGKRSMLENKESEDYKSSKRLAKHIGLDYDTIAEAIHENPDIDDVEQAMIISAVPSTSEDPLENRYLFDFFDRLYEHQDHNYRYLDQMYHDIQARRWSNNPLNAIVIQDRRFKFTLSNEGIIKRRRVGTIGAKGECTSSFENQRAEVRGIDEETGLERSYTLPYRTHTYRKQISTAIYEEIQVIELAFKYHINDKYGTVGDDDEDEILLVPIDRTILENYTIPHKEKLFSRSLHYVFNSLIKQKLAWYQTGFFQFVVTAIAAWITAHAAVPFLDALNAGIQAGTVTVVQVLSQIAVGVIRAVVVSFVLKLVVDIVGVEAAIVLAVLAAAYGFYEAGGMEGLANSPFARDLLKLSTGLIDAVSQTIKEAIETIQEDFLSFLKEAEDSMKLLEEADDLLRPTAILSPFVYLGESAEAFYNRTIHSGNVGVLAIESQSTFVDRALRLPELKDTLGGYA